MKNRLLLGTMALFLAAISLLSCSDEASNVPADEEGYLKNLTEAQLFSIIDYMTLQGYNPDAVIISKAGEKLVVAPDGRPTAIGGGISSIDLIAKEQYTSLTATIGDISHNYMNSAQNSRDRISLETPNDNFLWGKRLDIGFGDGDSHGMEIPKRMEFPNVPDFTYSGTAFEVNASQGLELEWNADASNQGGVIVIVEYHEAGLKPKRLVKVVEDSGRTTLSRRDLDFIDMDKEFTVALLRGVYKTYEDEKERKYLFSAITSLSGEFIFTE